MGKIARFPNPLPLLAVGRVATLLIERHSPAEIANAIDVLVDLLDFLGGDPDLEESDPLEDCDPAEDDDAPEDDDPGGDEHDGREPDEDLVPCFGLDQTAEIVSDWRGFERVPDIPCTPPRFIE